MNVNAWQNGARWNVGQRGVVLFELGLRAFEDLRVEAERGSGQAFQAVVERATAAVTGRRGGGG